MKNRVLLADLEYKLRRILTYEKNNPNFFRQHITDIKNYLIKELKENWYLARQKETLFSIEPLK